MTLIRTALFVIVVGGLLFALAGRWDLPFFWAILLLFGAYVVAVSSLLDPEHGRQRTRPMAGGPDRALRAALGVLLLLHLAVAALDVGSFGWSDTVPFVLRVTGVAGYAASLGFILWAMRTNRFFVPAVRIQEERDHRVVDSGPYGFVRHPGYLGSAVGAVFGALALGSWIAFVPLAGALLVLVARTALEDRFLQENLAGYSGYADRVRYRLVPGLW